MIAVIYRFHLTAEQAAIYPKLWHELADYFVTACGALGSALHQTEDGLWVAYSQWPDDETRKRAWPGDKAASDKLPERIREIIATIQLWQQENNDLPQYDEICMTVVDDLLMRK